MADGLTELSGSNLSQGHQISHFSVNPGKPGEVIYVWGFPGGLIYVFIWASLAVQLVKNPPAMQEILVQFLGWEDPLEKG